MCGHKNVRLAFRGWDKCSHVGFIYLLVLASTWMYFFLGGKSLPKTFFWNQLVLPLHMSANSHIGWPCVFPVRDRSQRQKKRQKMIIISKIGLTSPHRQWTIGKAFGVKFQICESGRLSRQWVTCSSIGKHQVGCVRWNIVLKNIKSTLLLFGCMWGMQWLTTGLQSASWWRSLHKGQSSIGAIMLVHHFTP